MDDDDYGELFDEGALETFAEEGVDSDVEAEENERYVRRPRPAERSVERATEGASSIASRAARLSRRPPRTTRRRTRTRSLRTSSRWISCTGTGHTTAATTWRTTWTGSSSTRRRRRRVLRRQRARAAVFHRAHRRRFMHGDAPRRRDRRYRPGRPRSPASASGPARRVSCSRSSKGSTAEPWCPCPSTATGRFLSSVGLDDDHSVAVYDWQSKRMLANSKGDANRIFNVEYNPHDGRIVTGGVKHVKFWVMEGGTSSGAAASTAASARRRRPYPSRSIPTAAR